MDNIFNQKDFWCIYINDKDEPFTEYILNGDKTEETRPSDRLKRFVGKRVGLLKSGCGPTVLVGFADIVAKNVYGSEAEFDEPAAYSRHKVGRESVYHISKVAKGRKVGYVLDNVRRATQADIDEINTNWVNTTKCSVRPRHYMRKSEAEDYLSEKREFNMTKIVLTESRFRALIESCVREALDEVGHRRRIGDPIANGEGKIRYNDQFDGRVKDDEGNVKRDENGEAYLKPRVGGKGKMETVSQRRKNDDDIKDFAIARANRKLSAEKADLALERSGITPMTDEEWNEKQNKRVKDQRRLAGIRGCWENGRKQRAERKKQESEKQAREKAREEKSAYCNSKAKRRYGSPMRQQLKRAMRNGDLKF